MRKLIIAVTASAFAAGLSGTAHAQERSFACEQIPARYERDQIKQIAHNREMEGIVRSYMLMWDAKHIRAQCEAFENREPYEISCLNGKRDWREIRASIPQEYFSMGRDALRPFTEERRETRNMRNEAIDYCRDVGAITVWRD